MNKLCYTVLLLLSLSLSGNSQNNIDFIDSIAENVCIELNSNKEIQSITGYEFIQTLQKAAVGYKEEWEKELKRTGNSGDEKMTNLDYLLFHRLLQTCKRYRKLYLKYDMRVIKNDDHKKIYKTVYDLVFGAESDVDSKLLADYFDPKINRPELIEKLDLLKNELVLYRKTSGVFINLKGDQLYYYVNLFDYETGDDNVAIMIFFDDVNDNLIDEWNFATKEQIQYSKETIRKGDEILQDLIKDGPEPIIDTLNR